MSSERKADIVIGIPTYRRLDGLQRCLNSISEQVTSIPDNQISVIVAENDLDNQEAMALVAKMSADCRFALRCYLSPARGISQARNTLLDHGFGTHQARALAMIDDDQWIAPDWLEKMYQVFMNTHADAIGCRVVPDFMGVPHSWVQELKVFHRRPLASGHVKFINATCGILLSSRIMTLMPEPRFDEAYSFTGGGDTEFFMRLNLAGGRFGFCAEAVAHECYPAERQTLKWVRRRHERLAMTNMLIRIRTNKSPWFHAKQVISIFLASLRGLIILSLLFWLPKRREDALRTLFKMRGKVKALFGKEFEYYR